MLLHANTAGVNAEDFWDSTLKEVVLAIKAYGNREINEWRRTREIVHTLYSVNVKPDDWKPKFEFMPLEGDPTPEEIEAQQKEEAESLSNERIEVYNYYQSIGAI